MRRENRKKEKKRKRKRKVGWGGWVRGVVQEKKKNGRDFMDGWTQAEPW